MTRSQPLPGQGNLSRDSQPSLLRNSPPPTLSLPTSEPTEIPRGDPPPLELQSQLELQSLPELLSLLELQSGSLPDQPRPDLSTLMRSWTASLSTARPSSSSRTMLRPTLPPSPAPSPSTRTAEPSRPLSSRMSRAEFSSICRTVRLQQVPARPQW